MQIINIDGRAEPLITPRRPDQVIDFDYIDAEVYVPFLRDSITPARGANYKWEENGQPYNYAQGALRFDIFNDLSKVDPVTTKYGIPLNRRLMKLWHKHAERTPTIEACNQDPMACYLAAQAISRKLGDALDEETRQKNELAKKAQDALDDAAGLVDRLEYDPDTSIAELQAAQARAQAAAAVLALALAALDGAINRPAQVVLLMAAIAAGLADFNQQQGMARTFSNLAGKQPADRLSEAVTPAVLKLSDRLRQNAKFRKIMDLVGRYRTDVYNSLMSKARAEAGAVVEVERGNDIPLILPEELAELVDPDLALLAAYNFVTENMEQLAVEESQHAAQGDALVLIDCSGSMDSRYSDDIGRIGRAKAFALALASTLARARRSTHIAFFNTRVFREHARTFRPKDFDGRDATAEAITHITTTGADGGTEITEALRYAAQTFKTHGLVKPDVVVISDGEDRISAENAQAFSDFRNASQARLLVVFVGVEKEAAKACDLGKLADHIWHDQDMATSLHGVVGEVI